MELTQAISVLEAARKQANESVEIYDLALSVLQDKYVAELTTIENARNDAARKTAEVEQMNAILADLTSQVNQLEQEKQGLQEQNTVLIQERGTIQAQVEELTKPVDTPTE